MLNAEAEESVDTAVGLTDDADDDDDGSLMDCQAPPEHCLSLCLSRDADDRRARPQYEHVIGRRQTESCLR